jgi:hypothetical protein
MCAGIVQPGVFDPEADITWAEYARLKGWSASTASRRKSLFRLVLIELPGMRTRIIPRKGDLILRGELDPNAAPIRPRRRPGRPRKDERRQPRRLSP